MKAIVQRYPLAAFVLIAFGWTWPLAAGMRLSLLLPLLGLFGPMVAALMVLWALEDREGIRGLWRRFALRRHHVKWLVVAVVLPPLLLVLVWLVAGWTGPPSALRFTPIAPIGIVLAFLIVGEEAGWRGFALPYLLERWPALWSSLVLGLVWALWHLPNFFLPGYPHQGLPFTAFVLLIVSYSVLFTWLSGKTDGSLLLAVVFHAALNLFSLSGVDPVREYWCRAAVYGVVAALVGTRLRSGRSAEPGHVSPGPAV